MTAERTQTLLTEAIEASTLSRKEIAARLLLKEGTLRMMLQGITRVPLYLIPRLSRLLEIDERLLLIAATEEYYPEVFKTLTRLPGISREDVELGILTMCRSADAHSASPKS